MAKHDRAYYFKCNAEFLDLLERLSKELGLSKSKTLREGVRWLSETTGQYDFNKNQKA